MEIQRYLLVYTIAAPIKDAASIQKFLNVSAVNMAHLLYTFNFYDSSISSLVQHPLENTYFAWKKVRLCHLSLARLYEIDIPILSLVKQVKVKY